MSSCLAVRATSAFKGVAAYSSRHLLVRMYVLGSTKRHHERVLSVTPLFASYKFDLMDYGKKIQTSSTSWSVQQTSFDKEVEMPSV